MTVRTIRRPTEPGLQAACVHSLPDAPAFHRAPARQDSDNHRPFMARAIPSTRGFRTALLSATAVVLATACRPSGPSAPSTTPRPVPAPPPVVAPPAAAAPNVSPPAPHSFAYAAGVYRYEVRTDAVVTAEGQPRVDSISTRALVTYRITRGPSGAMTVDGTVDTFTVTNSRAGVAAPAQTGVPFTLLAFPDGRIQDTATIDSAAACATPVTPVVIAGREILAAFPVALAPAAAWTDSTMTVTCRGTLPLVTRAIRQSRAAWALVPTGWARHEGDVAFEITRTTTTTISGQGHSAGRQVDLGGQGEGSSVLYVDPELGVLLGGVGNASTRILVDAGSQRQEFVQTVHQQVRLLR